MAGGLPGLHWDEETALCAAVRAAYDHDELEMLLFQNCGGKRLDLIAAASVNFEVTVFKVVRKARAEGWLHVFVGAAVTRRPGNEELRAWHMRYAGSVSAQPRPEPVAAGQSLRAVQLMDSAHFDLTEIRDVIRKATSMSADQVIGFGVTYPEAVFVQKLLDWLRFYLHGETQPKATLSLMPEIAPLDYWLSQLRSYRDDLAMVNVLCEVAVRGVAADVIEEFWTRIREEFGGLGKSLVLVFTGDPRSSFPGGMTVLPQPRFSRPDVAQWAENLIWERGWPPSIAHGWTERLCTAAAIQDEHLDVRLLYEAMDRSVTVFRRDPEQFRALHEKGR